MLMVALSMECWAYITSLVVACNHAFIVFVDVIVDKFNCVYITCKSRTTKMCGHFLATNSL